MVPPPGGSRTAFPVTKCTKIFICLPGLIRSGTIVQPHPSTLGIGHKRPRVLVFQKYSLPVVFDVHSVQPASFISRLMPGQASTSILPLACFREPSYTVPCPLEMPRFAVQAAAQVNATTREKSVTFAQTIAAKSTFWWSSLLFMQEPHIVAVKIAQPTIIRSSNWLLIMSKARVFFPHASPCCFQRTLA